MTPPNLYRSFAPIQIVHRGLPLWAFRFLAARQGTRTTKVGLCLLGAGTDKLAGQASLGLFAVGKGGEGGGRVTGKGELGGGRRVGWVRALACYRYAAREKGNFAHCDERPGRCPGPATL